MNVMAATGRSRLSEFSEKLGATPYILTVFLSAALVFLVQPMFAKMATPLLGGAPAVWAVSLVCFQVALLAGYTYAHLLARLRTVRLQVLIHAIALVSAAFVLPLSITGLLGDPDPANPALWLIGVFALSIAPPFAIISATAPLVQNWYARSGRPDADDPYHLYSASNIGSLIGLTAYPLLLEPLTSLASQSLIWSSAYGVLAILLVACGLLARARGSVSVRSADTRGVTTAPAQDGVWKERLIWLGLAFIPSSLLLGTSTHISTDVAAAPFLWAPPLMAYITTFIIVFAKRPIISTMTASSLVPIFAAGAALALASTLSMPWPLALTLHVGVLFMAALACHSAMADRRPPAARLTEFYLLMSLGGVLGAMFNAFLAPVLFNSVIEYPLMICAALLVRPDALPWGKAGTNERPMLALIVVALLVALVAKLMMGEAPKLIVTLNSFAALAAIILTRASRWVPVAGVIAILVIGWTADVLAGSKSERGFFGVIRTVDMPEHDVRLMMHGTTMHGAQSLDPAYERTPLSYYAAETPIGQAFTAYMDDAEQIGVVGLGVGSVACYSQPGQDWTFYEIDPLVAQTARDPARFTFLSGCMPEANIVLGDARITIAQESEDKFDLLLLDAFSSDMVPAHLLTREAMRMYLSRLSEDGVMVFHISNRHLKLETVLARVGGTEGASMLLQNFNAPEGAKSFHISSSQVVAIARNEDALARLAADPRWKPLVSDGGRAWTDDYSNIIGAMLEHAGR